MESREITEMLLQLVCSMNKTEWSRHCEPKGLVGVAIKQLEAILEYRYESDE